MHDIGAPKGRRKLVPGEQRNMRGPNATQPIFTRRRPVTGADNRCEPLFADRGANLLKSANRLAGPRRKPQSLKRPFDKPALNQIRETVRRYRGSFKGA